MDQQTPTAPAPKKNKKLSGKQIVLIVIGAFIALCIIGAIAGGSSNSNNNSNTPNNSSNQPEQSQSSTSQQSAAQPAQPPAARKVTGTATTLGAGTFTGGKDVAAGLYDVSAGAGQSGNFSISGTDSYNEILGGGDSTLSEVPKVRVQISDGDQITISGLSTVRFTPVTAAFVTTHTTTNLYAGTFTVGQDVGAGRYVVTPGPGQSGNFSVSGSDSYNEILGSDKSMDEVPSVSVTLTDGDVIAISGLSLVTFTPSN